MPRLHEWLRASSAGLMALAVATGAGAGAGAVGFRYLILGFTRLFTGRSDYSDAGHVGSPHFPGLGIAFVVLVPVIGGLVYGPLVDRFAREARGHGVPEVMFAVAERGGRIAPQVAVVKSLASALCIGSGGSVGREGPIVQIGSALGSTLGQGLRMSETRLRLLVACGAAGGISATFNAPIAGVFFALELILRDFETESFGAVVLASVTSAVIGRAAFGSQPFLALPAFHVASPVEFVFYAVLGVLAAAAGVGFTRILYGVEDLCDRLWRGPEWLRPAAGGVLLGVLLLVLPEMYGVGYPVLQNGVTGHYVAWFLIVLLVGKIVATSLTIGIGGSGGVFAPSLFMGAMLGTAFGDLAQALFPHVSAPPGAYGLVGMGAVFAGAARAPITAVLIIFELTGDYSIVLPLMTAIVLATALSSRVSKDTIYTLKLRRRGIDIMRGRAANLMEVLTVADGMQPVPRALRQDASLDEVIEQLADEGRDALPVVDDNGGYRGAVTSREVEHSARDNALDMTAGELARVLPGLHPTSSLHEALSVLVGHEGSGLPVLSQDDRRVIGWMNHRDILLAYSSRLRSGAEQAAAATPVAGTPPRRPRDSGADRAVSDGRAAGNARAVGKARAADDGPVTTVRRPAAATPEAERIGAFRVVDLELSGAGTPVGLNVTEVSWPASSHLLALRRDGQAIPVTPETVLATGDRLTLLVASDNAVEAAEALQSGVVHPTSGAESGND
jgi:CIC family chloride channel protein